jgi:hypothetical protein
MIKIPKHKISKVMISKDHDQMSKSWKQSQILICLIETLTLSGTVFQMATVTKLCTHVPKHWYMFPQLTFWPVSLWTHFICS